MRRFGLPFLFAAPLIACSSSSDSSPPPDTCSNVPASALVSAFTADPHYCMIRFASGLQSARQLAIAPNGDIFVAPAGQIVALYDNNSDGVSDMSERTTFASVPSGNHGLAITSTHLYASSMTTVYRWPYKLGDRMPTGAMETVVHDLPSGGHATRTVIVDAQNRLYVSIGSGANVDAPFDPAMPPVRATIRRYDLASIPAGGYAVTDGEPFAYGLRNEVGLFIDSKGRMWGVENGRDNLDVGGDIHYDNPAEEVNLFDTARPGRYYGFPSCWSEGIWMDTAMAKGPGTQHLDPVEPGMFTEAKCQDASAVVPPAFVLGAHMAPLDIVEYTGTAYPAEMRGNMFVASHGSWNRETDQVGRVIVRLKMGASGPTEAQTFLGQADSAGMLVQGSWNVRPVSVRVDKTGLLVFSDDASGGVYKIGYKP